MLYLKEEENLANYIENFQKAINYIEDNLTNGITLKEVSEAAHLSSFHFTRLFHRLVGDTPSSYIRKRRLTEASKDLTSTDSSIIDIAFKYQFQSQASFTRSFKKQFFLTPKKIRKVSNEIKFGEVLPLNSENLVHRTGGGITFEPEIIETGTIKLVGNRGTYTMEKHNIPDLWRRFLSKISSIKNIVDYATYGVSIYTEESDKSDVFKFDYLVGCQVKSFNNIPKGMVSYEIPSGKYAVFTHKGLGRYLIDTYNFIYRTWLPSSGRDFIYSDHFELRKADYKGDLENSETYIYIPLSEDDK